MSKASAPPITVPPTNAPPSYSTAVGGVPPQSPFVPPEMTTIVTTVVPLGQESTHMVCPHCQAEVNTKTKSGPSMKALLWGSLMCVLGCSCGCCLIPCCMQSCMDVTHECPNCQQFLGKYSID